MHLLVQNACWCRWDGVSVSIATFSMNYQSEGGDRQNGCTEFTGSLTRQKRGQPSLLACNLTFHDKDVRSRSVGLDWCRLSMWPTFDFIRSQASLASQYANNNSMNIIAMETHTEILKRHDAAHIRASSRKHVLKHTHRHTHTHTCLVDFFL